MDGQLGREGGLVERQGGEHQSQVERDWRVGSLVGVQEQGNRGGKCGNCCVQVGGPEVGGGGMGWLMWVVVQGEGRRVVVRWSGGVVGVLGGGGSRSQEVR